MKSKLFILLMIVSLASCKKDENETSNSYYLNGGLLIANEGNYQSANSSLTYINPVTNIQVDDIYTKANDRNLGDVTQSLSLINNKLYIVVNNSGKIEICDPHTMLNSGTITGLTSPRYICQVNNSKAYVSDLFANHLSVINLSDNSVSSVIPITGWTEQMVMTGNRVYVTDVYSDYLYVVDPDIDRVSDSILISKGAVSAHLDINNKLWVLCTGDFQGTYSGALYQIDVNTKTIEKNFSFPSSDLPSDLTFNPAKDSLYFINNNIYKMGINESSLPANEFITTNGNSFFALAVSPSNEVYVSDAIDFIQRGRVYRYNSAGIPISNFLAGILPGDFLFLD